MASAARMSSDKRNSADGEQMCVVCFKSVDLYSIGICDHPVCFECSTRMRVLCRQNECPICRQDMPKVIFCRRKEPFKNLYARLKTSQYYDHKFGIIFQSVNVYREYVALLEHNCRLCEHRGPFNNFQQLKDHMRREHDLYYCELCVENLRIFTWERKAYNRTELGVHRRKGDSDDTSHRGHPLCKFCDTRYMDSDELFRHLRRDHLYCHFCDTDGLHQYYPSYECLRQHFLTEHYLCEEGDCEHEEFTSVFRTDIDLKAHRASVHGKNLGKAGAKQARTLELEFTLAPRARPELQSSRGGRKPQPSSSNQNERMAEGAVGYDVFVEPEVPRQKVKLTAQDFPTLGGVTAPVPPRPPGGGVTIRHITRGQQGLARTDENFPALADTGTVRVSVNTVSSQERSQSASVAPNVSIHVNHSANGAITTHISQNSNFVRLRPTSANEFPALGVVSVPDAQWVKPAPAKEVVKPRVSKVAPAPVLPSRDSPIDFPSLNRNEPKRTAAAPLSSVWLNHQDKARAGGADRRDRPDAPAPAKDDFKDVKAKSRKKKARSGGGGGGTNSTNCTNGEVSAAAVVLASAPAPAPVSTAAPTTKKTTSASKEKDRESAREDKEVRNQDAKKQPKEAPKQNGLVKKRSELKIDSLQVSKPSVSNGHDEFPPLGGRRPPPPGFAAQPPPGFSASSLTFTSSSGQSYAIVPAPTFRQPPNFAQRNRTLVDKFMTVLRSGDAINEFKTLSALFRSGDYPPAKFYEHCEHVLGAEFDEMFPELLVLLPDIGRQHELHAVWQERGAAAARTLDVCTTCRQILCAADLASHAAGHAMDDHFPTLAVQDAPPTCWKK